MTDSLRATARRRGRPPASDSAVTRERILQAARRIFAESGYEAATFQAIAVEIGLTRPAINIYFPSKSALYGEVVARAGDIVLDAVRIAAAAPDLGEQVLEFVRVAFRGQDADPALAGFLVQSAMEARHAPLDRDPAAIIDRFVRDAVAAAIERQELGPDVDTDGLTDTLTGVLWGAAFQVSRRLHPDRVRADRMLGQLDALLDHGVRRAG
ncbi:MAG TPA: TetR/AcrR family transcriptional regulator [Mycobacterium sp.]|uniref:TetR/AcrR family transcriptional regulator n=1 Tax=Mycolicibacterium sp. TaxID=2320850 RepID=UPI0025DC918A|nr:TetR/AcrR family transcriptional regulator [Mycolicibacterium sp.]HPX37639.1 TetR/AcrR family transcriptional regulator [Mycobacterium sp.]HQC77654.1 TetR/AcrR family transcriptional regulator [Mycobacterium sp.]